MDIFSHNSLFCNVEASLSKTISVYSYKSFQSTSDQDSTHCYHIKGCQKEGKKSNLGRYDENDIEGLRCCTDELQSEQGAFLDMQRQSFSKIVITLGEQKKSPPSKGEEGEELIC